ncbi:MAG: MOSC domain-containing protein [Chloroflexi bacterium]|nr:MOSC domain-containing protein [Chloroflexota bacterium]OJV95341.1 MAG: MOSC domain-containing protein [Chloroflexi bacterium 54-19]
MQPPTVIGKVLSVNVGLPRSVEWKRRLVYTGIFKEPVKERIRVDKLNFKGDAQADLSVHGGPDKAIYVYPAEYYDYWRSEFPEMTLDWGMFGENLTVTGLRDDEVNIGDRFQIGSTKLVVTQPRLPCYKLAVKFGRDDILRRFLKRQYTGFYLRVLQEGEIGAGDKIISLSKDEHEVKVTDIVSLYTSRKPDLALMKRAIEVEALPASWKDYFQE